MSGSNKRSWDAGRFLETLNYFGEVPFIGSFRWLQRLMGQTTAYEGINMSQREKEVAILSSSDRTSAFNQMYQSEAWQYRLENQIQAQLSASTHFIFYDFANERSSQEKLVNLIKSSVQIVVLETSVLSTLLDVNRIVLGESPDFVERKIFDFSESNEILAAWGTLDDVVMGGVSQSGLSLNAQGCAIFAGNVSTENSGGFASVRTKNFEPPFNCLGWEGMRLRIKGDGQRYKFILRNSDGWDSPAYIYGFDTEADKWLSVDVPFAEMVPTFRAKSMPDASALNPAQVYSFQLMLSKFEYDRQLNPQFEPGPFSLQIESISTYRQRPAVPFVVVVTSKTNEEQWQAKLAELGVDCHWLVLEESEMQSLTADSLAKKMAPLLNGPR